jgi:hypothetical protein
VVTRIIVRQRVALAMLITLFGSSPRLADAQTATTHRVAAFAKLPNWSGLWEWDVLVGQADGQQLSSEGLRKAQLYLSAMQPPYSAAWQPKYDQIKKALKAAIDADPNHPPASYAPCQYWPFPATALAGIFEWRVTPEEATLINTLGAVRHIYTDGRSHPSTDELWPTRMGDSVGHWEGDTLVVDTVATKPLLRLAPAEVLKYGLFLVDAPMSDQLHTVERIRMVNHNQIQIQTTIDDPVALTKPIRVTVTHVRVTDTNRITDEDLCDNDRNPVVNGKVTTITH